jgi:hypothetical protein
MKNIFKASVQACLKLIDKLPSLLTCHEYLLPVTYYLLLKKCQMYRQSETDQIRRFCFLRPKEVLLSPRIPC